MLTKTNFPRDIVFPTMIVDDWFEDPVAIREYALSCEYTLTPSGKYPGKRSELLHTINPDLFHSFTNKLISIFWDFNFTSVEYEVTAAFQMIRPQEDPELNIAWAHFDNHCLFGGVLYLDPNPMYNSGTTLGHINVDLDEFERDQDERVAFQKGDPDVDIERYKKYLKYNNDNYTETITVENKFNRLLAFDGLNYHRINYGNDPQRERLTLVFFVNFISADNSQFPLQRALGRKLETDLTEEDHVGVRDKVKTRMDELQRMMESNMHLEKQYEVYDQITSVTKFWTILSEEDKDYIHGCRHALEYQMKWNVGDKDED